MPGADLAIPKGRVVQIKNSGAVVVSSLFAVLASTSGASAGMVTAMSFDNRADWIALPTELGLFPAEWTTAHRSIGFNGAETGPRPSISGSTSIDIPGGEFGIDWTATSAGALGGTVTRTNGHIMASPSGSTLVFTFGSATGEGGSGLRGIGGHFGFLDADGNRVAGRAILRLSDGSSLFKNFGITNGSSFAGFWVGSDGPTITEVRLQPVAVSPAGTFAAADSLYFGWAGLPIPAPGSIALLGAAGLIGYRRRR